MRILLLTTHLNIGGISSYVITLAKELKARGAEVIVMSSGGILVSELAAEGISHIKIGILTKSEFHPKVFKAAFEVFRIARRLNIDVIHAHTRVTQIIGLLVSGLAGTGFVTTCHGFFRQNIARALLPAWGECVVAISEAVQEHLIKDFHVEKHKISLIYNGIDVKKFLKDFPEEAKRDLKDKFGIRRDHSVIGMIARFTPDKGHDVLLYSLRGILKERPNVQLVFVGDGKERPRILDLTQRLGLTENVIFIKSQMNTVSILSVMDIFMFTPRRKEGLGIALLEALASGKPVVATNVGGIPSAVEDNVNGFLVPPSRPHALVEPVVKLLKDKELYKRMSHAAREIVIEKFSSSGMADKVQDVYKEILGRRKK